MINPALEDGREGVRNQGGSEPQCMYIVRKHTVKEDIATESYHAKPHSCYHTISDKLQQ